MRRTIYPATAADAEPLLKLQQRAYQSEAHLYNDWSLPPLTQTLASMLEDISTMTVLKAVENGTLAGSVRGILQEGICTIGRLIVEPSHQRQGIGSALLQAIEACFPTAVAFALFTGSRSGGNLRLYRCHGFLETHRTQVAPHLTLVFLSKHNLSPLIR
jgi:GNAT superfamily N-acetyltransferase